MDNIISEIEKKCHEKLMIYHDLLSIFRKEKKSIVDGDVSALWRLSSEKHEKAKAIEAVRGDILNVLDAAGIRHKITQKEFELEKAVNLFSGKGLKALTECLISVNRLKKQVQSAGKANLKFVEEYLSAINDIVHVAAGARGKNTLYNRKRHVSKQRDSGMVLIRREV